MLVRFASNMLPRVARCVDLRPAPPVGYQGPVRKTVVVAGAWGFVGSHQARALADGGHDRAARPALRDRAA